MVSFLYLRFIFPEIKTLVMVFANVVLKTYDQCSRATLWNSLHGLHRPMHSNIGRFYVFKDQKKGFVKVLILFIAICLIFAVIQDIFYTCQHL